MSMWANIKFGACFVGGAWFCWLVGLLVFFGRGRGGGGWFLWRTVQVIFPTENYYPDLKVIGPLWHVKE